MGVTFVSVLLTVRKSGSEKAFGILYRRSTKFPGVLQLKGKRVIPVFRVHILPHLAPPQSKQEAGDAHIVRVLRGCSSSGSSKVAPGNATEKEQGTFSEKASQGSRLTLE